MTPEGLPDRDVPESRRDTVVRTQIAILERVHQRLRNHRCELRTNPRQANWKARPNPVPANLG
jgi:hypothetical protein